MADGAFEFENCLLKHHIRTQVWLPLCKKRRAEIKKSAGKQGRRLRYFTFCAVGALDVLMLVLERVLAPSPGKRLDTVFFFDRSPEFVNETTKRIAGSIGFPGDFVDIVLDGDPVGVETRNELLPPEEQADTSETRKLQVNATVLQSFVRSFPFDIINLDLEQFLFPPKEEVPGRLLGAMRRVFEWQRRDLVVQGKNKGPLDSFCLMFTTQVGPPDIKAETKTMLRESLSRNLISHEELKGLLDARAGHHDIEQIEREQFDLFFKLGVPKLVAETLDEEDWYVHGESGMQVFEFQRESKIGPYTMLHMIFEVRRKAPPKEKRAPKSEPVDISSKFKIAIQSLFRDGSQIISNETIQKEELQASLDRIKGYRRKVYPDGG